MSIQKINTSRAKEVEIDIFNYDNIPLSGTYTSSSVAIDLTDYKFEFFLWLQNKVERSYSINAGVLSTSYLLKTGADVNVLDMEAMFEDIRDKSVKKAKYRLVQVVTDPDGKTYAYIVYNINAERY